MADFIREKIVRIKRNRRCFACERVFTKGSDLWLSTHSSEDGIYNIHECVTCHKLIRDFKYGFDDNENAFLPGCVSNGLDNGQTPEMLLEKLKNS